MPPGRRRHSGAQGQPTITDVAKLAKVSPATVSRVINGIGEVAPERVARVRKAIADLEYQPSGAARALRRQVTDVWAVIVADIENPYFTSVVRGIEDGARDRGYRVVLCNSDEDTAREADYIDVAIAERMSGVVIAVASNRSDLAPLLERSIPVVAIDRRPPGHQVACVLVDNALGACQATAHLIEGGAKRVACITGPRRLTTANERADGYKQAITAAGRKFDPDLVVRTDYRAAGGYEATRQLFSGPKPPDALFVANNVMTVGALQALRELGVDVPGDVTVVGFDDAPWASLMHPALSVVAQPTYEIGQTAAAMLGKARESRDTPTGDVLLSPTLIVRESSVRPTSIKPSRPARR